jgi:hypothetical protein
MAGQKHFVGFFGPIADSGQADLITVIGFRNQVKVFDSAGTGFYAITPHKTLLFWKLD